MMPNIIANLKFDRSDCGNCVLVSAAPGDWSRDGIYRKICPLFRQTIDLYLRCPACLKAEKVYNDLANADFQYGYEAGIANKHEDGRTEEYETGFQAGLRDRNALIEYHTKPLLERIKKLEAKS